MPEERVAYSGAVAKSTFEKEARKRGVMVRLVFQHLNELREIIRYLCVRHVAEDVHCV